MNRGRYLYVQVFATLLLFSLLQLYTNIYEINLHMYTDVLQEFVFAGVAEESQSQSQQDFYSTVWPPLKDALCGDGTPNLMLATTLFRLGRAEVFSNGNERDDEHGTFAPTRPVNLDERHFYKRNYTYGMSTFLNRFYSGTFGGGTLFHGKMKRQTGGDGSGREFVTLYMKVWKCGNNQIRLMEKQLYRSGSVRGKYSANNLDHIMARLKSIQRQNQNLLPPTCIYTAIRDPISHFLSGYNEMEYRQLSKDAKPTERLPKKFREAPFHREFPYSSDNHELRKRRFQAFVEDVLLEKPVLVSNWIYIHFYPMSRILVSLKQHGLKLTGYIPDLANLTSTWPDFMSSRCPQFLDRDSIPTMRVNGQHESSKDRLGLYRAAKDVWAEGGPISRSLCLVHAFDYACFDDLPGGIPVNPCQSVYRQYAKEIIDYSEKVPIKSDGEVSRKGKGRD
mmetsp:Transcript_15819/g.20684  ORF Transcript_15819/g.20684 Transcript_15819/m.20684 type:complete len:449 (+) Transcript_15819:47-1393(+)